MARHPHPSDNGRARAASRSRHVLAPPEVPPSRWVTGLFCLVTVTWVLAFAPEPLALATIPGVVGWLAVVERSRSFKEVSLWIVIFGATATILGYRWLAETVQLFGQVPVVWSWVLTGLFGVWNVLHGFLFAAFYRGTLRGGRRPHPLLTVILLAGAEALPIRMFAWSTGHGAVNVPPILQAAEWGGVPAVSFVLLCLVIPLYEWLRWVVVRGGAPARPGAALATFLLGLALFGFGWIRYAEVKHAEEHATDHLRVGIVQANIGSDRKRRTAHGDREQFALTVDAYERGTRQADEEGAELIVWPESVITDAVPMQDDVQTNAYLRDPEGWRRRVKREPPVDVPTWGFLNEVGQRRAFLVGIYEWAGKVERTPKQRKLPDRYNVAGLRQPGLMDAPWSTYRKVHLIPFGETMPFGIMEERLPQNFRMLPGALPQDLLTYRGVTFAPFVCYEAILADHVREYVAGQRADVLVSLTNDSWFGDTWEPHQHLNFTRFRAVEHRAPIVRATNTGISAFISATGDVADQDTLGVGVEGILVREVPLVDPERREPTVFVRFGYHFRTLLWILALAGWVLSLLRAPPVTEP